MKINYIANRITLAATVAVLVAAVCTQPVEARKKHRKVQPRTVVVNDPAPDRYQAGSQQFAYPVPNYYTPALTPAPAGYEPFHIESYARHGSRWLIGKHVYSRPAEWLAYADSLGQLTDDGRRLMNTLFAIDKAYQGHDGELTPLGARQHRGIARRMAANFPTLFTDSTNLDAKSTKVIRCILSMANEVSELENFHPGMRVCMDASQSTQDILAPNGLDTLARNARKPARPLEDSLRNRILDRSAFLTKVYKDPKFAVDSLEGNNVFDYTIDVAVNSQSHDGLYDIYEYFTDNELANAWRVRNLFWYIYGGNTSLTDHRTPYMEMPLVREIIAGADTAVVAKNPSLNMRFGHDSIVLPLTVFLELDSAAYDTDNINTLSAHWRDYSITPMASNIQFVFYRPVGGKAVDADRVLVKAMLNEREVTLPATPVSGPYYKWSDVRRHYLDKMEAYDKRNNK